jgi:peptidoglycan-N-acetylglucosamine deacetylase
MKRTLGLALVTTAAILAACASQPVAEEEVASGADAFSQKQLMGGSLPAKTVSLTFDDGPGPRTGELSTFLKGQGVRAAFFVQGSNARGKETLLQQLRDDGHVVANHSTNHPLLTKLSPEQIFGEINGTQQIIAPFQEGKMMMFRAPFGGWSPRIGDEMNKTPISKYIGSIFWDIGGDLTATHAADWACWAKKNNLSVEECGRRYIQETVDKGRGIVLAHDVHGKTIDMFKLIVPELKKQNFKFVRIDQVPAVHEQLVAAGAQPLPSAAEGPGTSVAPSAIRPQNEANPECEKNWVYCGEDVGRDKGMLYRCTDKKLFTVCKCADDCRDGWRDRRTGEVMYGRACTCQEEESEPGIPCDPSSASCQ